MAIHIHEKLPRCELIYLQSRIAQVSKLPLLLLYMNSPGTMGVVVSVVRGGVVGNAVVGVGFVVEGSAVDGEAVDGKAVEGTKVEEAAVDGAAVD